jgi:orotidine-5'-phosphate decarboxylase
MGSDSMLPFAEYCDIQPSMTENRGVYILNLTSNPGAEDFEMLETVDGKKVYMKVSEWILAHAGRYPGLGAVIGAPNIEGLRDIAKLYAESPYPVPPLIPGVGGQGGKFDEVAGTLQDVGYEMNIVRINISSGLTHPWGEDKPAPDDWYKIIVDELFKYNKMSGLA